jgi:hypothetical protein
VHALPRPIPLRGIAPSGFRQTPGPASTTEWMRLQACVSDVSTDRMTAAAWTFPRLDRAMLYPVSAAWMAASFRISAPDRPFRGSASGCLSPSSMPLSGHRYGGTVRASEKRVHRGLTSAPRARLRKRFSRSDGAKLAAGIWKPPGAGFRRPGISRGLVRVRVDVIAASVPRGPLARYHTIQCRAGSG